MIRAIIFDWDGVLLESAEIKTRAFARLFGEICPDRVSQVVVHHLANMGLSRYVKFRQIYEEIIGIPLTPDEEQALGRRFSELIETELLGAPLVPGVQEFLGYAQRRGTYALFVASGSPEEELRSIAQAKGVYRFFLEWHGSPKTKPSIIRDILTRYKLSPTEVVFVGDAVSDRLAAEETGVTFIARVISDNSPLCDCRYRISDLSELRPVLELLEDRLGSSCCQDPISGSGGVAP